MERTNHSATQILIQEEPLRQFQRELQRLELLALLALATHVAETADGDLMSPQLVEEHKEVTRLIEQINSIFITHNNGDDESKKLLHYHKTGSGYIDPGFGIDDNPDILEEECNG